MAKHIYSLMAVRDKMNGKKPSYNSIVSFFNDDKDTLKKPELEQLKNVLTKEYEKQVSAIESKLSNL